jgi:hypothetical protein
LDEHFTGFDDECISQKRMSHTAFIRVSAPWRKPQNWTKCYLCQKSVRRNTKRLYVKPSKLHCVNQSSILLFGKWAFEAQSLLS